MQHLKARQRQHDKRWDYTSEWQNIIHPIGYCHAWKDPDAWNLPMSEDQKQEYRQFSDKYHTDGHETAVEACECYKQYLLDHTVRHSDDMDTLLKCKICHDWTHHRVHVDRFMSFILCKKHANRETLEKLVKVGESWES